MKYYYNYYNKIDKVTFWKNKKKYIFIHVQKKENKNFYIFFYNFNSSS